MTPKEAHDIFLEYLHLALCLETNTEGVTKEISAFIEQEEFAASIGAIPQSQVFALSSVWFHMLDDLCKTDHTRDFQVARELVCDCAYAVVLKLRKFEAVP